MKKAVQVELERRLGGVTMAAAKGQMMERAVIRLPYYKALDGLGGVVGAGLQTPATEFADMKVDCFDFLHSFLFVFSCFCI